MAHRIRLHGPWQYTALFRIERDVEGLPQIRADDLPGPGTVRIPCDWQDVLGDRFWGRVRFTRSFHCPTGLDAATQVELVVQRIEKFGDAWLNGRYLGALPAGCTPCRFRIEELLDVTNRLVVEVESPGGESLEQTPVSSPAGIVEDVYLELSEGR